MNNVMLNFHCICQRLALACCDSGNETEYIKEVEGILTQIWKFFEYSQKRLNNFIKIQTELHNITLAGQTKQAVAKKVRKACRTCWLSLEQSVQSAYKSYIALLHTFQVLQADALALGLYKKIKTPKFLGTLFILKEVLLHLSTLSRMFQTGALNFARIGPAVQFTQFSLQKIKTSMSPIKEFEAELNAGGKFESLKIVLSESDRRGLETLSGECIESLKSNIQRRFRDCLEILKSFSIFNPLMLPSPESDEFKDYGERSTTTLADLFYDGNELEKEKLQAE